MATNTAGTSARQLPFQAVHYLRRTITFANTGASKLGTLPAGAQIMQNNVIVKTAWNGSAATLTVGTNATSYNNIQAGMTQTQMAATVNYVSSTSKLVGLTFANDVDVYINVANGATTAPSAGVALVIMSYVPNNDQ
jgi:hypothetical protein